MGLDSWDYLWLTEKLLLVKEECQGKRESRQEWPFIPEPGHLQVQGRYWGNPLKETTSHLPDNV